MIINRTSVPIAPPRPLRLRSGDTTLAGVKAVAAVTAIVIAGSSPVSKSDEGMWLFNDPPRALLKERYGFEITDGWLEHVQKAAVRFNSGGSGAFVSPDGLVISNFHVGADALQKLASAEKD